jgi:formate dehydrogenase
VFPLFLGLQSIPYIAATEALVPADEEQRDEATIYTELARASGVPLFGSKFAQRFLQFLMRMNGIRKRDGLASLPLELLLSLLLRVTGNGSFKRMLGFPDGKRREGARPDDFLGVRVVTEDGLVHLAPERFVEATKKLDADFEAEKAVSDKFKLITKRSHTTTNSWTQNIPELVRGPDGQTNYLYMHPDDAEGVGLANGDVADVSSEVATLRVPVRYLPDLMRGTVALPHGWGHQDAVGLSVASKIGGVNVNLLAADGPDKVEELSGMAQLTGILVEVTPAAGALEVGSWSGIAEA